jgi:DNA-binding transcriptional MerR regulator
MESYYTSAKVCQQLGIATATLAMYERRGDVPQPIRVEGMNGARIYSEADVNRLKEWREEIKARKQARRGA